MEAQFAISALSNLLKLMVGRGKVQTGNDAGPVQVLQVIISPKETPNLKRLAEFGFTSWPMKGADAVAIFRAGNRTDGVIIATGDQRYRFKLNAPGEVALSDAFGKSIWLKKDGGIVVEAASADMTFNNVANYVVHASTKVTLSAPTTEVSTDLTVGGTTSLHTVAAGTWHGDVIGSAYGGAGAVAGVLKANGAGTVTAAVPGTDFAPPTSGGALQYGNGAGGFSSVTIGAGVSFIAGVLSATGTGGSVTSVGLALPAIFTVSGSPVTGAGTLTAALANQNANVVWAGPATGSPAAPSFRALVGADLPAPAVGTLGGVKAIVSVAHQFITSIDTAGNPILAQPAATDISGLATVATSGSASDLSAGTLAAARGGAGTINGLLKANGSGTVSAAVAGTDYAAATSGASILYGNGAGGFSSVTIGAGVSFAGGVLSATGTGGSVTSVGLALPAIFTVSGSPVTGAGTLTAALANQNANVVWAGPATGSPAAPSFRALVGADLPNPGASSLGGIQSIAAVAHKFLTSISTSGVPSSTQPATSDLSDFTADTAWTPAWTGLTVVGTVNYTAYYLKIGPLVYFSLRIVPVGGATHASTGGVTYAAGLPSAARQAAVSIVNASNVSSVGQGLINTNFVATPTWAATNDVYVISGCYNV